MPTLGGTVPVRNGDDLDFCWRECVESLLPVCDQVVICDSDSTDGTTEAIKQWAAREPKIKYVNWPHKNPKGDGRWVMKWQNFARENLDTDFNISSDADEVLHEDCYDLLLSKVREGKRRSLRVQRWNFWEGPGTMVPFGHGIGHEVIRVAPQSVWMPADFPDPEGQEAMDMEEICLGIQFFHYGFLRHPEAFFKKAKIIQAAFSASYDPQFDTLEQNRYWMANIKSDWKSRPLEQFHGTHPKLIHHWLRDRGYEP